MLPLGTRHSLLWGRRGGGSESPKKSRGGGPPPLRAEMPLREFDAQLVAWINPEGCPLADQLL